MIRLLFGGIIAFACLCGCSNDSVMRELRGVDSLIRGDKDSVAGELLRNITVNSSDKEQTAYYSLLKTELLFRQGHTLSTDSLIDRSIDFYSETGNHHELARAYYFKARINRKRGDNKKDISFFKLAENEVNKTDDHLLKSRIYNMIRYRE